MWVFRSGFVSASDEAKKLAKFVSGRIGTFLVEYMGFLVFVKLLAFEFGIVKIFLAIIVVILNYIISKLFVFKKQ